MTYSEHRKNNRKISGINFMTYFTHYRKNNRKNKVFGDEIRNTKSTIFSYSISKNGWWASVDSNHGPQSYQDCALTS